jgi:hypothetical protein
MRLALMLISLWMQRHRYVDKFYLRIRMVGNWCTCMQKKVSGGYGISLDLVHLELGDPLYSDLINMWSAFFFWTSF